VALVGYLIAVRGAASGMTLVAVPPWVLAAAVAAHLLTLALRTEAWRTVIGAAGGERVDAQAVHAANSGAFLAGTLQGQAALPTRVALLRRFAGEQAPAVSRIALGDAPIVLSEALPPLRSAAGGEVSGRVAISPNAYDDIVEELELGTYTEIILETPPAHQSHWLHVDLPQRVSGLGLPTEAVAAT
jgi:hypothetical protein